MDKHTVTPMFCTEGEAFSLLEKIAREGAQRILQEALEYEVAEFVSKYQSLKDATGKRVVNKNGYMPERTILSGIGPIKVNLG